MRQPPTKEPISDWVDGDGLWFVPMRRHDGKWVVIGVLGGSVQLLGCAIPTEFEAQLLIERLWAEIKVIASRVLIEPPPCPI